MEAHSPYDRPDLYDLVAPADAAIEQFYIEMVRKHGPRVLDLACGSGRFTIPIARSGAQVVGVDLSEAMLQRARFRAEDQSVEIEWMQRDMRDFDLNGRLFDTVIVAANSIMHLHDLDDFSSFFRSVERHLAPAGRLVFDTFLPSLSLLSSPPDLRHPVGQFADSVLGKVTLEETIRYDAITQISHVDWYWSTDGRRDFLKTPLQLRQIFPQEMPLLVSLGGLRLIERFGDFDGRPLSGDSYRQISVCVKA